jgi:hypothetical protein
MAAMLLQNIGIFLNYMTLQPLIKQFSLSPQRDIQINNYIVENID